MLKDLFPRSHQRYLSLPVLGSMTEEFSKFLIQLGYLRSTTYDHLVSIAAIDSSLQQQGCSHIKEVTRAQLQACAQDPKRSRKKSLQVSAAIKLLEYYFYEQEIWPPPKLSIIEEKFNQYSDYLHKMCGLTLSTIQNHLGTVSKFLDYFNQLDQEEGWSFLSQCTLQDIENFVRDTGNRVERGTLQHTIAHLRSLYRFLSMHGKVSKNLGKQIEIPRIYKQEQLPRALPWETVQTLLQVIDRSTAIGKRDYAILLLMSTYGLRASEIVSLKFNDIKWRSQKLHLFQKKNNHSLVLPLTDEVAESIIDYLRQGRPKVFYHEIFVRHRAPSGALKPTAITEIFQAWSRRSGLPIPFKGPHCLRHSYATNLIRQGISIKTIGDILGHQCADTTRNYLRLAVEDLRTVPLSLPTIHQEMPL